MPAKTFYANNKFLDYYPDDLIPEKTPAKPSMKDVDPLSQTKSDTDWLQSNANPLSDLLRIKPLRDKTQDKDKKKVKDIVFEDCGDKGDDPALDDFISEVMSEHASSNRRIPIKIGGTSTSLNNYGGVPELSDF